MILKLGESPVKAFHFAIPQNKVYIAYAIYGVNVLSKQNKNRMKKLVFSILIAVLFVTISNAQTNFGVKAGLNLSSLTSSLEGFNVEPKFGFHLGGYAVLSLTDKFSIQPELVYSFQGAKEEGSEEAELNGTSFQYSHKSNLKLQYVNIPILIKFNPVGSFYVLAGPQFGFIMSAKAEYSESYKANDEFYSASGEVNLKDAIKDLDLGATVGLGVALKSKINVDLRLNYGLTNIATESEEETVKNAVLQLSVGYRLTDN